MKQTEQEISNVLKSALCKPLTNITFDAAWNMHIRKKKNIQSYRKAAFLPLIILLTLLVGFSAGAAYSRLVDDTDLPFVNDPAVIGKWESVDFVCEIEDFVPDERSTSLELFLNNLVFIKGGRMLDRIENSRLSYSVNTWTKGFIIDKYDQTASAYHIKEMNGEKYLFMEWKSGDYIYRGMKPKYYVLKQLDTEDYSDYGVIRTRDKIDYLFINNPQMLGKWEIVGSAYAIDDFTSTKPHAIDYVHIKNIDIYEEGKLTIQFRDDQTNNTSYHWTEDLIIHQEAETASKCIIKTIDGVTYMFMEWKSRDYIYRGIKPIYYVLKKTE